MIDKIAGKKLHVIVDRKEFPVFHNDPFIVTREVNNNITKRENQYIKSSTKEIVKSFGTKLSLIDRLLYIKDSYNINYTFFAFEKYKRDIAFRPDVPLLTSLVKFCYRNNCYDIIEQTLNIISEYYLSSIPTRSIDNGVIDIIKSSSNVEFIWRNDWRAILK